MSTQDLFILNNIRVYRTAVLTTVFVLCITSPVLVCLVTGSLCFLTTFIQLLPLVTRSLFFLVGVWFFWFVLDSTFKWYHVVSVFLCLLGSLSIMPSRSFHVVANTTILSINLLMDNWVVSMSWLLWKPPTTLFIQACKHDCWMGYTASHVLCFVPWLDWLKALFSCAQGYEVVSLPIRSERTNSKAS